MLFVKTQLNAQLDAYIRFLNTVMSMKKAYEISDSVIAKEIRINLSKNVNQADQKFEMNVIISKLIRKLTLNVMSLSQLKFQDMIMMIVDHKETNLNSYVCFDFIFERILKAVKCFVRSKTYNKWENIVDTFKLLLRISWLYSMNAMIFVQNSSIQIENSALKEISKFIESFEMCFHSDYNLLMYFRSVFFLKRFEMKKNDSSSNKKKFKFFDDNLSNVDDISNKNKKHVFFLDFKHDFKLLRSRTICVKRSKWFLNAFSALKTSKVDNYKSISISSFASKVESKEKIKAFLLKRIIRAFSAEFYSLNILKKWAEEIELKLKSLISIKKNKHRVFFFYINTDIWIVSILRIYYVQTSLHITSIWFLRSSLMQ